MQLGRWTVIGCALAMVSLPQLGSARTWSVSSVQPAHGAVYYQEPSPGDALAQFRTSVPEPSAREATLEIATAPALDADGTLADLRNIGRATLLPTSADPALWEGSFATVALTKRGRYWFQYSTTLTQTALDTVQVCPEVPLGQSGTCLLSSPVMSFRVVAPPPACSDERDNDGDGAVDMRDWGCDTPADTSERIGPKGPVLLISDARQFIVSRLTSRFGASFRTRTAYRLSCVRVTRQRLRCTVSWHAGARRYGGTLTVTARWRNDLVSVSTDVRAVRRTR